MYRGVRLEYKNEYEYEAEDESNYGVRLLDGTHPVGILARISTFPYRIVPPVLNMVLIRALWTGLMIEPEVALETALQERA